MLNQPAGLIINLVSFKILVLPIVVRPDLMVFSASYCSET